MNMSPAALVVLLVVSQATPPEDSPEAKAKAQQLLKEGAQLYENGGLAEALEKFNEAYKAYASPKLLFNIGQASRDLGRLAEAMDAFEEFVSEATDAPSDMTSEARRSIDELVPKLGRLHIQCATAGTEVSVDGKLVGRTPLERLIWVIPGGHQVTGKHPDTAPAVENVEVAATAVLSVNLVMPPLSAVPVVPPVGTRTSPTPSTRTSPVVVEQPAAEPIERSGWLGRKWTWVAAAGTVAFAGTATVFGLSMRTKFDTLSETCGQGSPSGLPCPEDEISKVTFRRNMANVFWGLTAAAGVATGVLFFIEDKPVTVSPLAGEATGMLVRMTY
jgi:hypothetical protein